MGIVQVGNLNNTIASLQSNLNNVSSMVSYYSNLAANNAPYASTDNIANLTFQVQSLNTSVTQAIAVETGTSSSLSGISNLLNSAIGNNCTSRCPELPSVQPVSLPAGNTTILVLNMTHAICTTAGTSCSQTICTQKWCGHRPLNCHA